MAPALLRLFELGLVFAIARNNPVAYLWILPSHSITTTRCIEALLDLKCQRTLSLTALDSWAKFDHHHDCAGNLDSAKCCAVDWWHCI
jgi:hypothetical protein